MTDLHDAACRGDVKALQSILARRKTDINGKDQNGKTALHIAAEHGHIDFIKKLLTCEGLKTDITDNDNRTAIQLVPPHMLKQLTIIFSQREAKAITRAKPSKEHEKEEKKMIEDNTVEGTEMVNPRTLRKLIVCLVLPFIILIFINGPVFAIQYITTTLTFYFIMSGYFVSEITIRPPWYHHHPKSNQLTMRGCPDYWNDLINDPKTDLGLHYTDVSFTSTDRYTLRGWYVPPPATTATKVGIVLVHGGGRDRRAWLRHIPFLHHAGYGCLLFDMREHGLSDGNMRGFSYGMKERFDVVAACEFMRSTYGYEKICAMGTSVGGSSAIMAAAIDKTIDLVIAENAILTCATLQDQKIVEMIGGYFSRRAYSTFLFDLFRRMASFWLNVRVGNTPSKHCQALHCIDKIAPRPILLMHGTADNLVPCLHSAILFEAAKEPKELYISEGAFHCGLYNVHQQEYEKKILSFLERHTGINVQKSTTAV